MKFLITGYRGQLGYDIVRELDKREFKDYLALGRDDMDITDRGKVMQVVLDYHPDVIFHCAAWTQVDKAEDMVDDCYQVNVMGTKNIVDASLKVGAKIIYISTDYVFDGTKDGLYTEEDEVHPMSVYGRTKYEGEEEVRRNPKHYITRVSWLFGIHGHNFIKTMLKLSRDHDKLSVVDDQIGSPTYTVDLARLFVDMSLTNKYGTYHATNEEYCSWAEFADYIFKSNGIDTKVKPVSTEEYLEISGTKQAYRPRNSKLSKDKLKRAGFKLLPSWKDATKRYCDELEQAKILVRKKD